MNPIQNEALNRFDPVERLKGCGKKTASKLQAIGIQNCGDLIDTQFTTPNQVFLRLQSTARNLVQLQPKKNPTEKTNLNCVPSAEHLVIEDHNWKGLNCHAIRRQRLVRVEIGPIIVKPHRTSICVDLTKGGVTRRRYTQPSILLLLQSMWLLEELTSETSDPESSDPVFGVLPKFTIDFDQLQNKKGMTVQIFTELKSLLKEVSTIQLFLDQ